MSSRWIDTEADVAREQVRREEKKRRRTERDELKRQQQQQQQQQRQQQQQQMNAEQDERQRRTPKDLYDEQEQPPPPPPHPTFGPALPASTYTILNPIEKGTYGVVSRAQHLPSQRIVALKRLRLDQETTSGQGFPVTALREIQTLRASRPCPHTVDLEAVVVGHTSDGDADSHAPTHDPNDKNSDPTKTPVHLVLTFVPHDLRTLLLTHTAPPAFTPAQSKTLTLQLASALSWLHARNILHRDVKPSNILLTSTSQVQLADFGMARFAEAYPSGGSNGSRHRSENHRLTALVTTLWYRAPELLVAETRGEGQAAYGAETDVWSLGCVAAELLRASYGWNRSASPAASGHGASTREGEAKAQGKSKGGEGAGEGAGEGQRERELALFASPTATAVGQLHLISTALGSLPHPSHNTPMASPPSNHPPSGLGPLFPSAVPASALDFLHATLDVRPELRARAVDVQAMEWFASARPRPEVPELMPGFPSKAMGERRWGG